MEILIAGLILAILGLLFGIGLGIASRSFSIPINQELETIISLLPGANCGACGKAGCAGFAQSLLAGELDINACKVSEENERTKISEFLGKKNEKKVKAVAVLHCNGGRKVMDRFIYDGIEDCISANLVLGGQKACIWGCLGFGTCVKKCPFSAISMSDEKLPVVNINKCTACGVCVKVCPKKLFSIVSLKNGFYIACSSHDDIINTKANCPVGCISCGICTKVKDSPFYLNDNLSYIDYKKIDKLEPLEEAKIRCPVKCILKL